MTAPLPSEKPCGVCGVTKRADAFYVKSEHGTKRLSAYCKACERPYQSQRVKAKYRSDPKYRAAVKRRAREWKQKQRGKGEHQASREWIGNAARHYTRILMAAGWRQRDIGTAIGACRASVGAWHADRSVPTYRHLQGLRQLAEATIAGKVAPPVRSQRMARSEAR